MLDGLRTRTCASPFSTEPSERGGDSRRGGQGRFEHCVGAASQPTSQSQRGIVKRRHLSRDQQSEAFATQIGSDLLRAAELLQTLR